MTFPLLVKFTGTFFGHGFIAEVGFEGRLLARHEDALWWMEGVNPGAVSAEGDSLEDAHAHFREALKDILVRFAHEARSFRSFKEEVSRFVHSSDDPTTEEWQAAVDRVRQHKECLDNLPIRSAAARISVTVTEKTPPQVTPDDNVVKAEIANAEAA